MRMITPLLSFVLSLSIALTSTASAIQDDCAPNGLVWAIQGVEVHAYDSKGKSYLSGVGSLSLSVSSKSIEYVGLQVHEAPSSKGSLRFKLAKMTLNSITDDCNGTMAVSGYDESGGRVTGVLNYENNTTLTGLALTVWSQDQARTPLRSYRVLGSPEGLAFRKQHMKDINLE